MNKILVVDDEDINLRFIQSVLSEERYELVTAKDGVQAWDILEASYREFDVVLLDRMMPEMDGMALTAKMKAHAEMCRIPIIMQTAAAQKEQVAAGIAAGVYYYLTKPYNPGVLISIVTAAISDYKKQTAILQEVKKYTNILSLVDHCQFSFATVGEARHLTSYLANFYHDSERVSLGISELLINAVEHGNLAIGYEEKTRLNAEGRWEEEVDRRQKLSENRDKKAHVSYERTDTEITLIITDEGLGFDWKKYLEIDMERATDSHGRGIALAKRNSFDRLEYRGNGNEVCCKVSISD